MKIQSAEILKEVADMTGMIDRLFDAFVTHPAETDARDRSDALFFRDRIKEAIAAAIESEPAPAISPVPSAIGALTDQVRQTTERALKHLREKGVDVSGI